MSSRPCPRVCVTGMLAVFPLLAAFGCSDPDWVGTYTTTGRWNLSGPLSDGRSAGDALADLVIEKVVEAAPVPESAEDEIAVGLSALIRGRLKTFIDEKGPTALRADGQITALLASSLGDVRVESVVEVDEGGDGIEGVERFSVFEVGEGAEPLRLSPAELGSSEVKAEWAGEEDDDRFRIEPHPVALHYGTLVQLAAARVLSAQELAALEADVRTALDCSALVSDLFGGQAALEVDVGLFELSVDAGMVTAACSAVREVIAERALGVFALDAQVEVGGTVEFADDDGDGVRELKSGPEFGGILSIAPESIAPKVSVSFRGRRS